MVAQKKVTLSFIIFEYMVLTYDMTTVFYSNVLVIVLYLGIFPISEKKKNFAPDSKCF